MPFRLSFSFLLPALLGAGLLLSSASAAASAQLQGGTDQTAAQLSGQPTKLTNPPRLVQGRTVLPLLEVSALLGQLVSQTPGRIAVGRLVIDPTSLNVTLDAAPQPTGSAALIGDVLYLNARVLADGLNANLSFSDDGRSFSLTALPLGGDPLLPQARFSTDKAVYAPGEKVIYTDYPFDPDGADIVSRKWSNKRDVYFEPGSYTVTLQVTNSRGQVSTPYSRTLTVVGPLMDTPLSYALKYADPGESFPDTLVNTYPLVGTQSMVTAATTLIFSNSPEAPVQSGLLYQDTVSGRARLLAYHLNALSQPARFYTVARNLESRPVEISTERLGETAPTRIEGQLGQVTLLDYFAGSAQQRFTLQPGESVALYASPTLNPGSGVNVLQDITTSGRVELTFAMLEDKLPPSSPVLQQLPYLPADGKHVRGTFPNAVKIIRAQLSSLPARMLIGDGQIDPAILGSDVLSGQSVRLSGNYGVLYDIQIMGTSGVAVALSPRGGLYRGAMNVQDGPISQTVKLPRSGVAITPDKPTLLWRSQSDQLKIDFVPASGSNLPISLVFYQARAPGTLGSLTKTYNP
ncbi:copper amine oxidase N-terminal domain-containing protein [Deinococcus psychrotolerans]|uniref:Copper amine oxidase N-terminal domain-containing protein n=1 Tax=Deinococcus psychrotolerans TaxID=2489213 RepID=A0A3G8YE11_9DEIO|nr:copper amine oxidase N-terminal domain-containing protein [Deinococcus psychrotolerans]AZI43173.1 copper amine oxidase N-terminal domain-containing protein [Deinococcus psychrotolerans]